MASLSALCRGQSSSDMTLSRMGNVAPQSGASSSSLSTSVESDEGMGHGAQLVRFCLADSGTAIYVV